MAVRHISEQTVQQKIYGSIKMGTNRSLLVDADLSSLSAAKTAVDSDVNKLHVSERHVGARIKAGLDRVDSFISGYTTGTTAANISNMPTASAKFEGMTVVY